MIKLLKGNTPLIVIVAVVVALAVWQVNTWTRVNPKKKKIAEQEEIIEAERLKALSFENALLSTSAAYDSLSNKNQEDSLNFVGKLKSVQLTLSKLSTQNKLLRIDTSNLNKGVRVDLERLTYTKGLFGKLKPLDSTYTVGVRWGL